jgi:hypothetical protein
VKKWPWSGLNERLAGVYGQQCLIFQQAAGIFVLSMGNFGFSD